LNIHKLPRGARLIVEQIASVLEDAGAKWELMGPSGKGHYVIAVTYNGNLFRQHIPANFNDSRAPKNAVSQIKRSLRQLGWAPNAPAAREVAREDAFKNQTVSEGAASECIITKPEKPDSEAITIKGIEIPLEGSRNLKLRNEAMLQANERGATFDQLYEVATKAGWRLSRSSVGGFLYRAKKQREGIDVDGQRYAKNDEKVFITVTKDKKDQATDLALEIASAIAPIIERHLGERDQQIEQLKAQAEKFTKLKQLMED